MLRHFLLALALAALPGTACAAARILAPKDLDDAVVRAILAEKPAPEDVFAVRQRLLKGGGKLDTHVLANRGHANPALGSFSFFETYSGPMKGGKVEKGELFLGFFTAAGDDGVVRVITEGLLVELIAWDYTKKRFNFWELLGQKTGPVWRYAGDSRDILTDVAELNMGLARPRRDNRLRCSACHTLGGPIMKELSAPHNDWVTPANKLFLGPLKLRPGKGESDPANVAAALLARPADADGLAALVKKGITHLVEERAPQKGGQTLKQRLRSLFTTMEMNLVHDSVPYAQRVARRQPVEIPAEFFVDRRLSGPVAAVAVPIAVYEGALKTLGSRFAQGETAGLVETHHAFGVPARSFMDDEVVRSLINNGLLDDELVAAVLAVDFTTPVYSPVRASLLRHVPEKAEHIKDAETLRAALLDRLKKEREDPAAQALLLNLTRRDSAFHRKSALAYLEAVRKAASSEEAVEGWLRLRLQRRAEVLAAQTATLGFGGNVLEEDSDFKVVFPRFAAAPAPVPGKLRLSPRTGTVER